MKSYRFLGEEESVSSKHIGYPNQVVTPIQIHTNKTIPNGLRRLSVYVCKTIIMRRDCEFEREKGNYKRKQRRKNVVI